MIVGLTTLVTALAASYVHQGKDEIGLTRRTSGRE